MNSYEEKIINLLQANGISVHELISIKQLITIGNVPEYLVKLNYYMHKGDIQKIEDFITEEKKHTYDDFTYLLISFKARKIIACVWDSDELWDDPQLVSIKEL